jgi:hypothetical protein
VRCRAAPHNLSPCRKYAARQSEGFHLAVRRFGSAERSLALGGSAKRNGDVTAKRRQF